MSRRSFLDPTARERTTAAIRAIESETAAEVVVAVRKAAGRYTGAALWLGVALAVLAFGVLWFSPTEYPVWLILLDAAAGFAVGALLGFWSPGLRKLLTPRRTLRSAACRAADLAFTELGVAATQERVGILVFVSLLERELVVVPDRGVPIDLLSDQYGAALEEMRRAVARLDDGAFLGGLRRLTQPLAEVLPRQAHDRNELSDEVA